MTTNLGYSHATGQWFGTLGSTGKLVIVPWKVPGLKLAY